jgi:hypothetical protein
VALCLRHRRGRLSDALSVLRLNLRGRVHSVPKIPRVTSKLIMGPHVLRATDVEARLEHLAFGA